MRVICIVVIGILAVNSCVSSVEDQVRINETIADDDQYGPVYQRYSKEVNIISKFATKYRLTVTYLSDSLIGALGERYTRLYGVSEPVLSEASSKTGFFVSIFSPEDKGYDLTDSDLWKVVLTSNDEKQSPSMIKPLRAKDRWAPFFAGVSEWSREYLVIFDKKMLDPSLDEMVQKNNTKLIFSNADAIVTVQW